MWLKGVIFVKADGGYDGDAGAVGVGGGELMVTKQLNAPWIRVGNVVVSGVNPSGDAGGGGGQEQQEEK